MLQPCLCVARHAARCCRAVSRTTPDTTSMTTWLAWRTGYSSIITRLVVSFWLIGSLLRNVGRIILYRHVYFYVLSV